MLCQLLAKSGHFMGTLEAVVVINGSGHAGKL